MYLWLSASQGHVVWEWIHTRPTMGKGFSANDVLLVSEAGGPVQALTTNGKGAEPTVDWPRVAYMAQVHFGAAGPLVVRDLSTQQRWQVPAGPDNDHPLLGDNLVSYRKQGAPVIYSLVTRKSVVLTEPRQYILNGIYLGQLYPAGNVLAAIGISDGRKSSGVAVFRTHSADPMQDLFVCPASH